MGLQIGGKLQPAGERFVRLGDSHKGQEGSGGARRRDSLSEGKSPRDREIKGLRQLDRGGVGGWGGVVGGGGGVGTRF